MEQSGKSKILNGNFNLSLIPNNLNVSNQVSLKKLTVIDPAYGHKYIIILENWSLKTPIQSTYKIKVTRITF